MGGMCVRLGVELHQRAGDSGIAVHGIECCGVGCCSTVRNTKPARIPTHRR